MNNCISVPQRLEREMQQKLEEKEESAVELQETYVSLQQEVEVKTKKLKKVCRYPVNTAELWEWS